MAASVTESVTESVTKSVTESANLYSVDPTQSVPGGLDIDVDVRVSVSRGVPCKNKKQQPATYYLLGAWSLLGGGTVVVISGVYPIV